MPFAPNAGYQYIYKIGEYNCRVSSIERQPMKIFLDRFRALKRYQENSVKCILADRCINI